MATHLTTAPRASAFAPAAIGTSHFEPGVSIGSPQAGALVRGTGLTVSGQALCVRVTIGQDGEEQIADAIDAIDKVEVRLGTSGSFTLATATGPVKPGTTQKRWSQWTCPFATIAGILNNTLKITARVTAGAVSDEAEISVQVDRTPPVLTLGTPDRMSAPLVNGTATFVIQGTASDPLTGVAVVERAVDGQAQFTAVTPGAPNNWSTWSTSVAVTVAGEHAVVIRAKDQEGNISPLISIVLDARTISLADVSSTTAHLDDLLEFAETRVTRPSGTTVAPLDRPTLTAAFHQPFDALAAFDDAKKSVARQGVHQARVCVEVLRRYLKSRNQTVPAAALTGYCQAAFDGLLRRLGTSSDEVRLTRAADLPTRAALAARLGIDLAPARPDELDQLVPTPDKLTETTLERLFGVAATGRAPFGGAVEPPRLLTWQLDHLRAGWQEQDRARRSELGGPLPIVDPDLIGEADLKTARGGDLAFDLLMARRAQVSQKLNQIRTARLAHAAALSAFDTVVGQFFGPVATLLELGDQYQRGQDVEAQLREQQLPLPAFVRLVRIRDLASAGSVIDAEWADVDAILLQVQKVRQMHQPWCLQETGLTLGPDHFTLPQPTSASQPVSLPAWRATPRARRVWQATLRTRVNQVQEKVRALESTIDAVEAATLPGLRDALIATADGTVPADPMDLTAREKLRLAADRLGQQLLIDLQSRDGLRTTRLDQAIETVQGALFAVRTGRFATIPTAPGTGPHPALGWALKLTGTYTEASFDEEWRWMGTYASWRSATAAFYYPQNSLLPTLRPVKPDNPNTAVPEQDPTTAFLDLTRRLREGGPLTPIRARQEASTYLAAVRAELGTVLPPDLRVPPPALKPAFVLTDQRTEDQLAKLGKLAQDLFTPLTTVTSPHQAPVGLKEILYFVPMLLALELHKAGQYVSALDWFQTVYAYNLSSQARKLYPGLKLDASIPTSFQRSVDWLLPDGPNPHAIAATRANALTQFTIISLVRCLLAFADAEFTRDTRESLPRARTLYETALNLLVQPEMLPPDAALSTPIGQLPGNPLLLALKLHADLNLDRIRAGRNVAGLERPLDRSIGLDGARVLVRRPTQYRYPVLAERARQLVATAQQIEAAFLAALEKRDTEVYTLLKARQDLQTSQLGVVLQDLRVQEASEEIALARLQQDRAEIQAEQFEELLTAGTSTLEILSLVAGIVGTAASAALTPISGNPLGQLSGVFGQFASFERRRQDWEFQLALARQDVEIGGQQIAVAEDRRAVVEQERSIALLQAGHAEDTVEFLANKFTNVELYDFMTGVLERVYSYFLQQATAIATLAERQLAFERQETPPSFIGADYWELSAEDRAAADTDGPAPDRRGLTGSARLLRDVTRLDQYAFETDRRKLQLTKTISLAQHFPIELQRFRETGVILFGTPLELFDRDFPGHYLRLIRRIRMTVVALIPPSQGIRASLSTIGTSRIVVPGVGFETIVVNHGVETAALSAPQNATGQFDLDPQVEMRVPFESFGVDTVWRLEMPRGANPFDFRTIADVLMTIEYTALHSALYRQQVVESFDRRVSADRMFSLRDEYRDAWFDLHNPDQTGTPMCIRIRITRDDFPPNLDDLQIEQVVIYLAGISSRPLLDPLPLELHLAVSAPDGSQARAGGIASSTTGLYSTRQSATAWRDAFSGLAPFGEWELTLPTTPAVRDLFEREEIEDIVFVLTHSGRMPDWPE